MGHCSNILQLLTHTSLEPAERHLQGHSLVHMAWLCANKVSVVCVQSQGFSEVIWCRNDSFQCSLLEAPYLVPWWEHMLARAGVGSSLFGGLNRSPFRVFLGDSGVGLYTRDFIRPSGPNGTLYLGNQLSPQNHSWLRASGHQDCVLFGAPGTVSKTECTDSFFLIHSTRSLTSNWALLF